MTPSTPNVNAKTIREAQDSREAQLFQRGYSISKIMQLTGKPYTRVKAVLELAGLTGVSSAAARKSA
jgi:hypothetical protein